MPLTETPHQQAMREMGEEKCPACGKEKRRKQSFCAPCYIHLPTEMRHGLWKGFNGGYVDAYFAARDWLLQESKAAKR